MMINILKSLLFGSLIGFLYAKFFINKFSILFYQKNINNNIIKHSISSVLIFLFLISIFILLYFLIKINLIVLLISFLIIFWIKILYELKKNKKWD
ncbi:MAG: hypothetical protein SZ59_C0002G0157 [candidate division TM6 bacterium GW2011_GWF2_28_16]|nr:MAG: hypothetical protein SZ59_C0002G0157 [candidate division TM6 bacterium GW2011_GWF2_28_16]